ncbi:MAG TPA: MOSC domain-containing protein, partial [Alphaproteobacteria bacterium]|nr:MOSC domain-containing protein [Alphaproteobacteria bacterium]
MTDIRIDAVLTGRARPFGPKGRPSAIAKRPVTGAVAIGPEGLDGDEQGDRRHHGGPEKAVHHYPFDHYPV